VKAAQPSPRVERIWPGSTVVCIGTGPSLTQPDVDACRDRARVIAVNDAYRYAPWSDVLYAADMKWWHWQQKRLPSFTGLKYSIEPTRVAGVTALRNTGRHGLERDPSGLRTGHNSVYQAVNLAVHLGASRIVLLGVDMQRAASGPSHCFGEHPDKTQPPYSLCLAAFATIVAPVQALGIEILNCTRETALTCFPCSTLALALTERAA
jgi:hypothetical protein